MKTDTSRQGSVAVQVVVGVIAVVAVVLGFAAIQSSRGVKADIDAMNTKLADQSAITSQLDNDLRQLRAQNQNSYALLSQDVQALKDQMTKKPVVDTKGQGAKGTNDTSSAVSGPTGPGTYHTIKSGDMLGRIAKQYGTSVEAIEKLNPGLSAKNLKVGKKIRVK